MSLISRIQDLATAIAGWVDKLRPSRLIILIDGGGVDITTGHKLTVPDLPAGAWKRWSLMTDATGSIQLDLKKSTEANWPTTATICGGSKPSVSAGRKNSSSTLTLWTTSVAEGDAVDIVVDSVAGVKWAVLTLTLKRT